jgi:hypothetical protein
MSKSPSERTLISFVRPGGVSVTASHSYFYLTYDPEDDSYGVAYSELAPGTPVDPERWDPPTLELRDGPPADYQSNDMGWRCCSAKLQHVLQQFLPPGHGVWLPVKIDLGNEALTYFVLTPPDRTDSLNPDRSIYAAGGSFIVKPVIDSRRIGHATVFTIGNRTQTLLVRSDVKDAIETANCTGIAFEPAAQS